MKSKLIFFFLFITLLNCKENSKKKGVLTEEKIEKKSNKNKEKHYAIKTERTEEEMNKLFPQSTLEDLKSIEKNKKNEKKLRKQEKKSSKENKKHLIISGVDDDQNPQNQIEEEDDDEHRPFDDFLLREVDYIDDTQNQNSQVNLLQINNLNNNNKSPFKYKAGYSILSILFICCLILFTINFCFFKNVNKEIFESDNPETYLLLHS